MKPRKRGFFINKFGKKLHDLNFGLIMAVILEHTN